MIITAVRKKKWWWWNPQWFADHENPFRDIPGFHIRPGYIIMADASRIQAYKGKSNHSKLFRYVFGQSLEQLQSSGVEFLGLGFSYQSRDTTTNEWFCDFKFKSSTFNEGQFLSFFPDAALMKGRDGTTRSINVWSENLSRIAIHNWIEKSHKNGFTFRNRITTVQEILNAENYWEFTDFCRLPPKNTSETCTPEYREEDQEFEKDPLRIENCFIPEKSETPDY